MGYVVAFSCVGIVQVYKERRKSVLGEMVRRGYEQEVTFLAKFCGFFLDIPYCVVPFLDIQEMNERCC